MKTALRPLTTGLLVLTFLTGCSFSNLKGQFANRAVKRDLVQHQQQWAAKQVAHYRYEVRVGCFCPTPLTEQNQIEIRNGAVVSIVNAETGQPVLENVQLLEPYSTIEKIFGVVQSAVDNNADSISVQYDNDLGYPTNVSIDYRQNAVDDEMSFTVSRLEVLNP